MVVPGFHRPPLRVPVSAATDWLLLRALGPVDRPWSGDTPVDLEALDCLRGAWELQPRIRARVDRQRLREDLTPRDRRQLEQLFYRVVAVEMRDEAAARDLAESARRLRIPLLFLKGAALRLAGFTGSGRRLSADIDVLVPAGDAGRLQRALVAQGARERDLPSSEQHLAVLEHPSGALFEVHHRLHGLAPGSAVVIGQLLESGFCRELAGWPPESYVPCREFLVAHLLVHGLGQHAYWPAAYPQLQLLADLQDLEAGSSDSHLNLDIVLGLVAPVLGSGEILTILRFLHRLSSGELVSQIVEGSDAVPKLARALLAGAVDESYRKALNLEGGMRVLGGRSPWLSAGRTAAKAVFLRRGQIDLIYGRESSPLGYWGRRLWRPFDLGARVARSLATWLRVRWRELA